VWYTDLYVPTEYTCSASPVNFRTQSCGRLAVRLLSLALPNRQPGSAQDLWSALQEGKGAEFSVFDMRSKGEWEEVVKRQWRSNMFCQFSLGINWQRSSIQGSGGQQEGMVRRASLMCHKGIPSARRCSQEVARRHRGQQNSFTVVQAS